jgi:hypothetical protein
MEIPDWLVGLLVIALIILGMIGAIYGLIYAISWVGPNAHAGQTYDVTVTVQAVERSTRWGDHTNVWIRTYGGGDSGTGIVYKLIGFHNFTVGKDYHIVFKDEPYLVFYIVWFWESRGRVELIELAQP